MRHDVGRLLREGGAKRVLIVGWPGAGKSTLARKISAELEIAHLEVDQFYWSDVKGGEVRAEFQEILGARLKEASWIIEGHYPKIRAFLPKPDFIIVLRTPIVRVLLRLLRRDVFEIVSGRQKTSDLVFVLRNRERLVRQRESVASDWLDTPKLVL